jgi:hypothetical protein
MTSRRRSKPFSSQVFRASLPIVCRLEGSFGLQMVHPLFLFILSKSRHSGLVASRVGSSRGCFDDQFCGCKVGLAMAVGRRRGILKRPSIWALNSPRETRSLWQIPPASLRCGPAHPKPVKTLSSS